jgi:hypothetical protein
MPTSKPSARSVIAAAVLLMAGIIAWRVSGPLGELLHAYSVHVSLTGQHSPKHPGPAPSPSVRYVVRVPKVCQP